jgi:hypothetical protein
MNLGELTHLIKESLSHGTIDNKDTRSLKILAIWPRGEERAEYCIVVVNNKSRILSPILF